MKVKRLIIQAMAATFATACQSQAEDYEPFEIEIVDQQFIAEGVIDHTTPDIIENAIKNNPEITNLVLNWVPGSADDESNLRAARKVRQTGLTTIVPSGGIVASGGTDLFLAGSTRIIDAGACIGVHSWASQSFLSSQQIQGRDIDKQSDEHTPYLDYYAEMGIDGAFYWYTLNAADADGMHWMSNAEIRQFNLATEPLSDEDVNTQQCEERA